MSKMKKILTIGGATQDIYLHYEGADSMKIMDSSGEHCYMLFESGSKIEVDKILYYTGGGATNSAVSFKRQGLETTCFCMVGNDMAGKAVLADLEQEGVNTENIIHTQEHSSGTSFVLNSLRRDRTIFAYRGANGFLQEKQIPFDAIAKADQLYITSLSNESAKLLSPIVKHAKKHAVPVAVNPGISQLSKGVQALKDSLQYVDILILNSAEAKTFMESLLGPASMREHFYFSIPRFFKEIIKLGPSIVVVTDGHRGVHVAQNEHVYFHKALTVDVVDTLGAGDSFGSCFVGSLVRGLSVEQALKNGIVNSASVIGKIGAKPGLLSNKELDACVKKLDLGLLH